jgi:hypothetical protein
MTSAWTKTFPCNVITWLVLDSFHLEFQVGSGVRLMGPTGAVVVASSGGLLAFDVPSELITGSCLTLVENRLSLSASFLELLSAFIAPGSKGTITPGFSHQPGVKSHTQRPVHHARTFTSG